MLFLLNTVVVQVPENVTLPRGLAPLNKLSPAALVKAGTELYARYPRLEYDRQDIAQWYCGLLMASFPDAGGAQFRKGPSGYVGTIIGIDFTILAYLRMLQVQGIDITQEVHRRVWNAAVPAQLVPVAKSA